jgi:GntR family transcriptional regulator
LRGAILEAAVIEFRLDRSAAVPAYVQLVQQVREALRLGWLQPGDQLPTVRQVVASCVVNANTVLKAYRELERSGLVVAHQGSGTFVFATLGVADPSAMMRLRGRLAGWVRSAREAGLGEEDMRALLGAVLAESRSERSA